VTVALTIIAGTAILLLAASKIPLAAAAFLRSCITLATALQDLRKAMHQHNSYTRKHSKINSSRSKKPRTGSHKNASK
jgi:Sec-independent protein translocase protein TatA